MVELEKRLWCQISIMWSKYVSNLKCKMCVEALKIYSYDTPCVASSNKCSTSCLSQQIALLGSLPEVKGQPPEGFMEQGAV